MCQNRVRAAMALTGVRVPELARGTGIPEHRLYRKLRGESDFRYREMVAVAQYLGINAGELFFDEQANRAG